MSDKSLVVKHAGIETIETALTTATAGIRKEVEATLTAVETKLAGWGDGTISKVAAVSYQGRLRTGIENLLTKLDEVATALADVREKAHDCEVDNVAIVD
jgi:hypothetical protein